MEGSGYSSFRFPFAAPPDSVLAALIDYDASKRAALLLAEAL
jgi:hypothetical protein